jgi:hypothetical protein
VWSGVFGAMFWIYAFWISAFAVVELPAIGSYLSPFYGLQIITFLWAILFSPFGQDARLGAAFVLVIVDLVLQEANPENSSMRRIRWRGSLKPISRQSSGRRPMGRTA